MAQSVQNFNSGTTSGASATTLTVAITVGAGVSRKIVCGVASETAFTLNALTFNGTSFLANLDRDTDFGGGGVRSRLYYYDIPDALGTGSYNVVLTFSGSSSLYSAHVWQLVESLTGGAESVGGASNNTGTTVAGSVTSTAGAAVLALAVNSGAGTVTFTGDATERIELNEANYDSASADGIQGSGGSKTVTATDSVSARARVISVASYAPLAGPTITVQPANDVGIISNGQSTVYTATATGTNVHAPTWSEDGSPIADGGIYDIVTTGAGTSSCTSTLTITRTVKTGTPFDIAANFVDDNGNTDTNTVTDTWWTGPVLTTFPATNGSGVSTATLTCDYVTGVGEAIEVRIPLADGSIAVTTTTTA